MCDCIMGLPKLRKVPLTVSIVKQSGVSGKNYDVIVWKWSTGIYSKKKYYMKILFMWNNMIIIKKYGN